MKKNITILSILLTLGLTACGSDSDSTTTTKASTTPTKTPATPTKAPATPTKTPETSNTDCVHDGETLVVAEGKTCMDNGHTLKCENGTISYDNMIKSGGVINMNGKKYTCE